MRDVSSPEGAGLRIVPCDADRACRLHTATLSLVGADGGSFELFHACRVASAWEVRVRLAVRVGGVAAAAAVVREGIDAAHPVVAALLGAGTARHLAEDGDLPGGALLGGGDLHVVQWRG